MPAHHIRLCGVACHLVFDVVDVVVGDKQDVCLHAFSFLATAYEMRMRLWSVIAYPVVFLLFVYILWRTMLLNLSQGGIRWRDTFYPLDVLRKNLY